MLAAIFGLMGATATVTWFWPHGADYYYDRGCELLTASSNDERWLFKWDLNRALDAFNRAIDLNPQYTAAYENRASVKDLRGDRKGALADYNRAIELNPGNSSNYRGRAGIRNGLGDVDGALADYGKALELNPNDRFVYMIRSRIMESRGDLVGAMMDRARMSELMPPISSQSDTNRGFYNRDFPGRDFPMRRDAGRWRDGRFGRFDRVLELNTNFSWGFYHRGVVRCSQNDLDGALADFRRCEELPDNGLKDYVAIHVWLVQTRAGRAAEANQELAGYLNNRTTGAPNDWPVQIARFLLNQSSEANLFAAISPADREKQESQFWYYNGMKQLLAGDKAKAAYDFRKSLDTKTRPYAVFLSARSELAGLRTDTDAPANP